MPLARPQLRPRAHRRRRRGRVKMCDRAGPPLRLRRDRALGAHSATARCAPSPAPTWWCCARRCTLRGENLRRSVSSTVSDGDRVPFVLTYGASHLPLPEPFDADAALQDTERFWSEWSGKWPHEGPWREAVVPLADHAQGADLRADRRHRRRADHSLPEHIGGMRNWDYRFCWLRDATFTLLALMNAGYFDEAQAWRDWLLRAVAGQPGAAADHVRRRRRAAPDRMGGAVAARLRELTAGAHRQRRARPASARRLRRGDGHAAPGPPRRIVGKRSRLGRADARCSTISRRSGASPTRASGRCAARAAALHPLQGRWRGSRSIAP